MMIMAMAVGLCICCVGGASTIVTLVNEKIIDVDFLDFLLIAGWGKEKADESGGTGGGDSSTNCIDKVIDTCKSGEGTGTLFNADTHDECVSREKTACLNDGGAWTSSFGAYPSNCVAGARVECVTLRGKDREKCMNEYKKKCKSSSGSSGSGNDSVGTDDDDCVIFYKEDGGEGEIHRHCLKGQSIVGNAWNNDDLRKNVSSVRVGKDVVFEGYKDPYMNATKIKGYTKPMAGKPTRKVGNEEKCVLTLPWGGEILTAHERGCSWANDKYIKDNSPCYEKISSDISVQRNLTCLNNSMYSYAITNKSKYPVEFTTPAGPVK